mmetsp:Transcript_24277/g.43488  ORF Transcript_24277/g.43488 Transcript_24277/m.43488 type:complete len:250 (-) Transcript_24277:466-1215(-)|eukprot:CAMPEP_0175085500 /NCGR_PEP_ID=MMETSP0052_2-20121109/28698_1 /TAXON_ID=51329 ORGANISM="Polytomella parva, Strain SAG 63-3" /NCGR_SAMPLE_ID=MMETSP0052_2 /ASSEMBLY_ACC=CAM_ASM_000194 /LENGTH=249 /DNA_ID=CAMNT_0016357519 /DNA_START=68 /DNA_END=817 /DNA_ORIENTATION=-
MLIKITPQIQALLKEAKTFDFLEEEIRVQLKSFDESEGITWSFLKELIHILKSHNETKNVNLSLASLCHGGGLFFEPEQPRKPNPEHERRLEQLRNNLEERRYLEMVSDITSTERKAESMKGMLPTYRSQLSFGVHVIVAMFTLFCAFYYGAKWYLHLNELWCGLSGVLGLSVALVVETLLLIIRTNRPEKTLEERMPDLFDPKKYNAAFAELKRQRKLGKSLQGKGKDKVKDVIGVKTKMEVLGKKDL